MKSIIFVVCVIITGMKKMGDYSFIQEDIIRGYYPFFSVLFGVEVSYINAFFVRVSSSEFNRLEFKFFRY